MGNGDKRSLISKVIIADNGDTEVIYSFSPTRFKFWLSVAVMTLTLMAMIVGMREGAYRAVEEFVHEKCGQYLEIFHQEVRPKLDADRADEINAAIDIHEKETSAEYATDIRDVQVEQAAAISEIKIDIATLVAVQKERQVAEEYQTRMMEEIVRRMQ